MINLDETFVKYLTETYNDRSYVLSQKEAYFSACLLDHDVSSIEARKARNDLIKEEAGLKAVRIILDHLSMCYQIKFEYTRHERECECGPVTYWTTALKA